MEVGRMEFDTTGDLQDRMRDIDSSMGLKNKVSHDYTIPEDQPDMLHKGGHPRFNKLLIELSELHARKNSDYSGDNPLANLKECENYGIPPWKGVLIRLADKHARIRSIVRKGSCAVKDESLIDTLRDQAVYSLLAIILMEEDQIDPQTAEKKC